MKCPTSSSFNWAKDPTDLGGTLLNQMRVGPPRVMGKVLHMMRSGIACMWDLYTPGDLGIPFQ